MLASPYESASDSADKTLWAPTFMQLVRQSIQSLRDELAELKDEQQRQARARKDEAAARAALEAQWRDAADAQKGEMEHMEQRARDEVAAQVGGVKGDAQARAAALEQRIVE
jgi:hypothetical protein